MKLHSVHLRDEPWANLDMDTRCEAIIRYNMHPDLLAALRKTRDAAMWFAENPAGTPVPEWVDDAINDLDRNLYERIGPDKDSYEEPVT